MHPPVGFMVTVDSRMPNCHNTCAFKGDVAQLGERCLRKAEAEGSNPFISTMNYQSPSHGALFMSGGGAGIRTRKGVRRHWRLTG